MDDVRWLTPGEQDAWRAYLDSTRLLLKALDRQLEADAGISLLDYEVLVTLSEVPGGRMRMRDLADATMSTRSGATRAVSRLEELGWVRRVDCAADRRGTEAELTAAGHAKLAAAAPGHVRTVRARLFDPLTPEQVGQLHTIGAAVRDNLQPAGQAARRRPGDHHAEPANR